MFFEQSNCNCNRCCNIKEALEKIVNLQRNAVRGELQEGCCRDTLGDDNSCCQFNTRPVTFYTPENRIMEFPVNRRDSGCNNGGLNSCVFRCECVNCDTCKCRVLVEGRSENRCSSYIPTDSFFIVRLCDIGAIRCLPDTFVDLCIR